LFFPFNLFNVKNKENKSKAKVKEKGKEKNRVTLPHATSLFSGRQSNSKPSRFAHVLSIFIFILNILLLI